jgi:hypothetical protein
MCHGSVKADPKKVKFDPTKLGASSTQEIIITNKGNKDIGGGTLDLLIDTGNITFTGASLLEFNQTNDCLDYIPYLSSCTITVTATPDGYGKRMAGLVIPSNDVKTSEVIVSLSVDAKPPKIKTKSSVSFSTAPGVPVQMPLVITNKGFSDLIISNTLTPAGTDAGEFSLLPDVCTPIQQGQSCTVVVTYTPASVKTSEAQIVIQSNDQLKSSVTVKLKGKSR